MSEHENIESAKAIDRSGIILQGMGLFWSDLENKMVLDAGSGKAALAHTAAIVGSSAKIFSVDIDFQGEWLGLPQEAKEKIVQGDVEDLPFATNTFDFVLNYGAADPLSIQDELRVLRPGGQMRMYPIAGQVLDNWEISYYLSIVKRWSEDKVLSTMKRLEDELEKNEGWRTKEYVKLQNAALDILTSEDKLYVIKSIVERYKELLEIPFSYHVNNPHAREPNGYLVYRKPL